MARTARHLAAAVCMLTLVAACGEDDAAPAASDTAATADSASTDSTTDASPNADAATTDDGSGAPDPTPDCDSLQTEYCSLPWPSNKFLVKDGATTTGYKLTFGKTTLPRNHKGVHVYSEAYGRLDGYGVGSTILVYFADVDTTNLASEATPTASMAKDADIVLLAVDTKGDVTRVPHFVELDKTANADQKRVLFVRPLVILAENTRYVVGMRNLVTTSGTPIKASESFVKLRDNKTAGTHLAARQPRFDEVFGLLAKDGIKREDLILAWDFHTASTEALHGDLLHVRDESFKTTGPEGAELKITKLTDNSKNSSANWAIEIEGKFTVPKFIKPYAALTKPAFELNRGADGKPVADGTIERDFWVRIPHTALDGTPHGLAQYGHGLLGRGSQVGGGHNAYLAKQGKLIFFACDWSGMADADYQGIQELIFDMSHFNVIVAGLHQGMMEGLQLARGMRERFAKLPEISKLGIKTDKQKMYYTGISQGGIYGGTLMALSQDITRGHLGVPGQNYSILLHRSVDFAPFFVPMMYAYEDPVHRAILLSAGQSLWDQVDPSSHYAHLKAQPHKGTPAHEVMLVSATGDWQVALLTNEIAARTGHIKLMQNYGKTVWNVAEQAFPYKGSALLNYSFGNPWPAPGNVPPDDSSKGSECGLDGMCIATDKCDPAGTYKGCTLKDPHGKVRKLHNHSAQMLHFFVTGEIIDVCDGTHCDPCGKGPCIYK